MCRAGQNGSRGLSFGLPFSINCDWGSKHQTRVDCRSFPDAIPRIRAANGTFSVIAVELKIPSVNLADGAQRWRHPAWNCKRGTQGRTLAGRCDHPAAANQSRPEWLDLGQRWLDTVDSWQFLRRENFNSRLCFDPTLISQPMKPSLQLNVRTRFGLPGPMMRPSIDDTRLCRKYEYHCSDSCNTSAREFHNCTFRSSRRNLRWLIRRARAGGGKATSESAYLKRTSLTFCGHSLSIPDTAILCMRFCGVSPVTRLRNLVKFEACLKRTSLEAVFASSPRSKSSLAASARISSSHCFARFLNRSQIYRRSCLAETARMRAIC